MKFSWYIKRLKTFSAGEFYYRIRQRIRTHVLDKHAMNAHKENDAAPLGFLSIAAHGHADALSFILHVDGSPILVDPGTFMYHTHKEL